jgi:bis(5'-nucleosidyl)-tetraphosphatase
VLRRVPEGWRLLLLRAFRNWDFPNERIDVGEDPLDAAVRETREETGLTDLALSRGHVFRETEPYAGGEIARFYIAQTATERIELPVSPELGRPEHHEWRWVSFDEARDLAARPQGGYRRNRKRDTSPNASLLVLQSDPPLTDNDGRARDGDCAPTVSA